MTLYFGKKEIPNVVTNSSSNGIALTTQQLENINADHSQYLTSHQDLSAYALKSEIPSDTHINALISEALGVIENGSY